MSKIKLLMGLSALVTALVVMVVPASAEFQTNGQNGQGPIKTFPELTTFESVEGGVKIECKSATGEPKGEWHIQSKTLLKQGKYTYQEVANKGPHEQLKIEKWGHCEAATFPVTVKCNLQIEQGNQITSYGSVQAPGCEVFVGTEGSHCIVNVPQDGNRELPKVGLENIGTNEIGIKGNVTGITSTLQETGKKCVELGIKGGQGTGSFKTKNALVTSGQKLV